MIKIDHSKINKVVTSAFDATVDAISGEFDNAIKADVWHWDGVTVRQNGDIVGSPRDVVDKGDLLDSQVIIRKGFSAVFVWEAPHSLVAHEGFTRIDGSQAPARRWTEYALQRFNAAKFIQKRINKELIK